MKNKEFIVIAIDGGAASGKSTTSRALADSLNLMHVDTGSHYRVLTHSLLQMGISHKEQAAVLGGLSKLTLGTKLKGRLAVMTVDGATVEDALLRSELVNKEISHYAAIPELRAFLKEYQRSQVEFAKKEGFYGLVMEGRDIGSVILPDAGFRFFLEADAQTRANRRSGQGQKDSVVERDKLDASRKTAPFMCPEGAIRIDTANMSLPEVVQKVTDIILEGVEAR